MKTIIYTGKLGPQRITCAGIKFTANQPQKVKDALAEQLLKKPQFEPAPVADAEKE